MASNTPDLTKQAPRSPRVRLGGYVILPRMLDKGRAALAGKNGEYHYNCPMDQYLTRFIGIDAKALLKQLKAGKGDQKVLEWIQAKAKHKQAPQEIAAWSAYHEGRGPADLDSREYFNGLLGKCGPMREDIRTWFDLLDLDDYVSFGGKA
jgi:hypothetical protein